MLFHIATIITVIFLAVINGLHTTIPASQEPVTVVPFGEVTIIHDEIEIEWLPDAVVEAEADAAELEFVETADAHLEILAVVN